MKTKQEEQEKRPYKKPELMQVPLRPEEAVLGNCKMSGGARKALGRALVVLRFPAPQWARREQLTTDS